MKRYILIDVQGDGVGEDLFLTNADDDVIKTVIAEVKAMKASQLPAEEVFITKILNMGFDLEFITNIQNVTVFTVENENF